MWFPSKGCHRALTESCTDLDDHDTSEVTEQRSETLQLTTVYWTGITLHLKELMSTVNWKTSVCSGAGNKNKPGTRISSKPAKQQVSFRVSVAVQTQDPDFQWNWVLEEGNFCEPRFWKQLFFLLNFTSINQFSFPVCGEWAFISVDWPIHVNKTFWNIDQRGKAVNHHCRARECTRQCLREIHKSPLQMDVAWRQNSNVTASSVTTF